jgi:single-strand DNA-binding protein
MHELRMPDINNILIAGNLTRDPSFRHTTNGTPVANFGIASNRRFKDNNGQWRENVCYVGVVAWYKLAENCAENLKKGSAVVIEGELQSRSLRTDDGRNRNIVEIKARRIQFLNKKDEESPEAYFAETEEADDIDDIDNTDVTESQPSPSDKNDDNPVTPSVESTPTESPASSTDETDKGDPLEGKYDFGYQDLQL